MEERDSALSDLTKVKADRTTSMEKLAGLNSEITSLHQRIEALSTEHRSLQRRFLTRGDQLIALRRICNEHGLGDIVRAKLNHMQQAVVRDRMQKGEHLRERLYTQVDRAENVQARRQRAATMMQEATRRASVAAQRTTNGSVASAAHNKKLVDTVMDAAIRPPLLTAVESLSARMGYGCDGKRAASSQEQGTQEQSKETTSSTDSTSDR
ncbi:hypothetical protein PTSG_02095 [Salpingoeca rosetta]|uniref:Uncharacterized protein n=1 Tax=Salpingoeca rosetta (strain ATCC 50818 / BSB-021) TaxID=946362 RepID=F2U2M1_SALR5|nr:uncharacterized protein PTSG_02095 [Salpingoeca rosetta]EGD81376.1 hypothetical protein PTSG_02095 [Salpingoeca rosetta]|eukprot:XP_004996580.1 hypothetical protein PTSG_02095 [Salpingoeca rosetta]